MTWQLQDMGGQMSDFMTVLLSNGLRTSVEADEQEKVGAQAVHEERESPKAAQSKQALAGRPSVGKILVGSATICCT